MISKTKMKNKNTKNQNLKKINSNKYVWFVIDDNDKGRNKNTKTMIELIKGEKNNYWMIYCDVINSNDCLLMIIFKVKLLLFFESVYL